MIIIITNTLIHTYHIYVPCKFEIHVKHTHSHRQTNAYCILFQNDPLETLQFDLNICLLRRIHCYFLIYMYVRLFVCLCEQWYQERCTQYSNIQQKTVMNHLCEERCVYKCVASVYLRQHRTKNNNNRKLCDARKSSVHFQRTTVHRNLIERLLGLFSIPFCSFTSILYASGALKSQRKISRQSIV